MSMKKYPASFDQSALHKPNRPYYDGLVPARAVDRDIFS